jgi:hypothetical protein
MLDFHGLNARSKKDNLHHLVTRKQNHPQAFPFVLVQPYSASNTVFFLNGLVLWQFHNAQNSIIAEIASAIIRNQ